MNLNISWIFLGIRNKKENGKLLSEYSIFNKLDEINIKEIQLKDGANAIIILTQENYLKEWVN